MKRMLFIIAIMLTLTGCMKQSVIIPSTSSNEEPVQGGIVVQPPENNYTDIDKLTNLFGFTNETAKYIILAYKLEEEQSIYAVNKAIGENGKVLTVKYLKTQEENEKDNGRLTAQNFDNLAGYIFEITQGTAKENETYYLVNDNEFNTKAILNTQAGDQTEIDAISKEEIEKIKNRKVLSSWQIGKVGSDKTIYLILFERENDDMLASIVMKTSTKLVFKDYPAKYDESSTWRVDDGGTVYPELYSILFASETESGIVLGIKEDGFEGEATYLFIENDDKFEELNMGTYRYTFPI
jgi:hypothetical protein